MDDFEDRLRRLSLEAPGDDLDRRIAGMLRNAAERPERYPRGVPFWATAVFGIVCGLIGAGLARVSPASTPELRPPMVRVEEAHAYPVRNPFDWSEGILEAQQGIRAAVVSVEVIPNSPSAADTPGNSISL